MKIPISDARRQLPQLIKQLRRDPGTIFTITVREEAVAELRAAQPAPVPGLAARKLLEIATRLPRRRRGKPADISAHVKAHLYGKRNDNAPVLSKELPNGAPLLGKREADA